MAGAKPGTVASYVSGVDDAVRPLFRAVRAFVRKHAPELNERLYMGVPTYWGAAPLLYVADHTAHVNLGFLQGASLADPDSLLEGTGKSLRHVKLHAKADLTPALARLVREAARAGKGTA